MNAAALLAVAALAAASEPAASPPPTRPAHAWWLPVVTLRLTHREVRSLAVDVDTLATPLGTTFELRLTWGASADPTDP